MEAAKRKKRIVSAAANPTGHQTTLPTAWLERPNARDAEKLDTSRSTVNRRRQTKRQRKRETNWLFRLRRDWLLVLGNGDIQLRLRGKRQESREVLPDKTVRCPEKLTVHAFRPGRRTRQLHRTGIEFEFKMRLNGHRIVARKPDIHSTKKVLIGSPAKESHQKSQLKTICWGKRQTTKNRQQIQNPHQTQRSRRRHNLVGSRQLSNMPILSQLLEWNISICSDSNWYSPRREMSKTSQFKRSKQTRRPKYRRKLFRTTENGITAVPATEKTKMQNTATEKKQIPIFERPKKKITQSWSPKRPKIALPVPEDREKCHSGPRRSQIRDRRRRTGKKATEANRSVPKTL